LITVKSFLIGFDSNLTTWAIWHAWNSRGLGWVQMMYRRQGNKQVANMIAGLCQGRKTALRTTDFWYRKTFYCFNRKYCGKI